MSVAIFDDFDIENSGGSIRICVPVASEASFCGVWAAALDQLGIKRLGNGVWLYRKELRLILDDFRQIREWAVRCLDRDAAAGIVRRIDFILQELPREWDKYPDISRLWMG